LEKSLFSSAFQYVSDQIGGRTDLLARLERAKQVRCTTQRLLRAVGNRRKEVPEHGTLLVHEDCYLRLSN
jgi:hypothetical protein